jgi:hypothetical protein
MRYWTLILVISRIAHDKQIENAIELARRMRDRSIGMIRIIAKASKK